MGFSSIFVCITNACGLSIAASGCEGAVVSHSNMDVMMPVAWPAAAESRLCLHWLLPSSLH